MTDHQLLYAIAGTVAGLLFGAFMLFLWAAIAKNRPFTFIEFVIYVFLAGVALSILAGVNPLSAFNDAVAAFLRNKRLFILLFVCVGSCFPLFVISLADAVIDRR